MKSTNSNKTDEEKSYRKLCAVLSRKKTGFTAADATAASALPLALVKELLPRAADEFSGRLAVTQSGEIIYSFPRGFSSRYRGLGARLSRFAEKFRRGFAAVSSLLFKIWIMVMLIGYFVLFIAIAVAGLVLSVAAQSKDSGGRRRTSFSFGPGIFNLVFRLWFYSELTRGAERGYERAGRREKSRPLHKAIFSFVFGDGDPNSDWKSREDKAVIARVQAGRGVISLPEFMAITGKEVLAAGESLLAFCARYGGSPEATADGTIVYRFDELLLRANKQDSSFAELPPPLAAPQKFSSNTAGMNTGFGIINAFNLIFGSYFLYSALHTDQLAMFSVEGVNSIYEFTFMLTDMLVSQNNPAFVIAVGLGVIPVVFSLLFWLVPALRYAKLKSENEKIKFENLSRLGFDRIWAEPLEVTADDIDSAAGECRPKNMAGAREKIITNMGVYSVPEVSVSEKGKTIYSFTGLAAEKTALEKYRAAAAERELGQVVFDSDS